MECPIRKFNDWWEQALDNSPLNQKSAVCVSTIDEHGFPAARFVDLKNVSEDGFVFCSYVDSAKGKHIQNRPEAAMTIWWDHVGYQVRIVGTTKVISSAEADRYWQSRNRSAQLTTTAFEQSAPLASEEELSQRLQQASAEYADKRIPRPDNWGGYCIEPISIEFLTFQESRLHLRQFFAKSNNAWKHQLLQP
ncbi:pyridoxine/pyridoxamine 5'-phosphate oxidase [Alteromonas facilis]|uniref:pyridoxine/pyridoxamine 5'-phosphate oxidase n=1 Tax=Alteromonas facilis TaxID=2048004 RepID=UPI000C289A6E|nr:pyridoxal 5'-phosphate synthase [Alteromonas facilis]